MLISELCVLTKISCSKPLGALVPLETPLRLWTSLTMDFIMEVLDSDSCTVVFTAVDLLTKMMHFISCDSLRYAETKAQLLVGHVIHLVEISDSITSD